MKPERISNLFVPSDVSLEAANIIQNTSPSQRELDNKALLDSIERIEAVDLSLETSNYVMDNSIEKKYPRLVDSIFENVQSYGNEFRDEEQYSSYCNQYNKQQIRNTISYQLDGYSTYINN